MTTLLSRDPITSLLSHIPAGSPRDSVVLLISTILAVSLVVIVARLRSINILGSIAARKIVHVLCAPLWIITWCFYTDDYTSRYYAMALPLCFLAGAMVGIGSLGKAVGRDRERLVEINKDKKSGEDMEGVLWYLVMMSLAAFFGWRREMAGVVGLAMMSFGDGIAEVVGRRWGDWGRWWGEEDKGKSFAGTAGFLVAGWIGSIGLVQVLQSFGLADLNGWNGVGRLGVVATVCAFVELVPGINDNIVVPAVAALLAKILYL